ncbi:lipopolysaccharide biosynthesis protein [Pseudomonas sp. CBMAI 2609]|uniref:Lipopolysaccharide biosynthesis protein n=1 Tax=Pseudomonas flavocrustae TaxID=2991719 RepID=A0ABT6II80_9PSED|nr:GNVR domain-containing protein [Pseudomonas sp. CBMAI 2609]MDH4764153.1 lipopolysaccharide biosynthesis protein [Pseudomonas sp. CBMAI 2609]
MIEVRSLRDLLRLFFIFRREFQLAFVVTVVVAILGAFLLPRQYESTARLLVKPGLSNTLPIEASDRQTLVAPSTQRDPILDEEQLFTGRPIALKVAESYLQENTARSPEGWWQTVKSQIRQLLAGLKDSLRAVLQALGLAEAQSPEERLATELIKRLSIGHEPGSSVMVASLRWDDPAVAQRLVQVWVNTYLEVRAASLERKSLYAFYQEQTATTGRRVEQLKAQLAGHLSRIGSSSVEDYLHDQSNTLQRMNAERFQTSAEITSLATSLISARQQIAGMPQQVVTEESSTLNPDRLDMQRQLNGLIVERERLLRVFLPGTEPLKQIDQNIAELRQQLSQQAEHVKSSTNRAPNGIVVNLKQQVADGTVRLASLKAQLAKQDQQIKEVRADLEQVMAQEPEVSRVMRELQVAQQNFLLYADNLEKARIDRALDSSRISNIAIIEQPTFNPSRVFPKSLLIILLCLPTGLAVGLLVIYLCYLLDQRIHDGGRIQARFGIPLWTTLQQLETPQPGDPAFTASLYRLLSQLPLERIREQGLKVGLTSSRHGEGCSFVAERLATLLREQGFTVRILDSANEPPPQALQALPGEVILLVASALLANSQAFLYLHHADLIALVVKARSGTVPMLESSLAMLDTAFKRTDGIIVNFRRFEVPSRLLDFLHRTRG